MQNLLITLKREYWENRAVIVGLPLIVATLALIAAIGVEIVQDKIADHGVGALVTETIKEGMSNAEVSELERDINNDVDGLSFNLDNNNSGSSIASMSFFIGIAWLASFYYLLGTLYNDRKDKSVLFWKSMPVSERFNVLSKLGFGTLAVTAISLVIGWGLTVVLYVFGLGGVGGQGPSLASMYNYLVTPLEAIIVGLFWGAPVFAYLAWASAAAKRSPFLLVIVPFAVLVFLEGVIFENVEIIKFFFSHMPFAVLSHMGADSGQSLFSMFFVQSAREMFIGLVVAACFTFAAIWYRDNRFEI
jgi:ABC-2 type transport system permease protein